MEELYTFFEALEVSRTGDAIKGVKRIDDSFWSIPFCTNLKAWLECENKEKWWPHPDIQKEKAWQVEPEKPKDIFVWVHGTKCGVNSLYIEKPSSKTTLGAMIYLPDNSVHLANKLQKYKLVAVDDS